MLCIVCFNNSSGSGLFIILIGFVYCGCIQLYFIPTEFGMCSCNFVVFISFFFFCDCSLVDCKVDSKSINTEMDVS